jgi:microcystin-dependent protein
MSPFSRGGTLFEDHTHPDRAHRHDTSDVAIPKGTIWLWYGVSTAVPAGWAICDGTNGTPDMRGRVPVGVDTTQTEFDVLGEAGGAKTHTLVQGEIPGHVHTGPSHAHNIPAHNHTLRLGDGPTADDSVLSRMAAPLQTTSSAAIAADPTKDTDLSGTGDTGNTGGSGAHNNLQPYRALHFIMRV